MQFRCLGLLALLGFAGGAIADEGPFAIPRWSLEMVGHRTIEMTPGGFYVAGNTPGVSLNRYDLQGKAFKLLSGWKPAGATAVEVRQILPLANGDVVVRGKAAGAGVAPDFLVRVLSTGVVRSLALSTEVLSAQAVGSDQVDLIQKGTGAKRWLVRTGRTGVLWRADLGPCASPPTLARDGANTYVTGNNLLRKFGPTGAVLWSQPTEAKSWVFADPSGQPLEIGITGAADVAMVTYRARKTTGALRWSFQKALPHAAKAQAVFNSKGEAHTLVAIDRRRQYTDEYENYHCELISDATCRTLAQSGAVLREKLYPAGWSSSFAAAGYSYGDSATLLTPRLGWDGKLDLWEYWDYDFDSEHGSGSTQWKNHAKAADIVFYESESLDLGTGETLQVKRDVFNYYQPATKIAIFEMVQVGLDMTVVRPGQRLNLLAATFRPNGNSLTLPLARGLHAAWIPGQVVIPAGASQKRTSVVVGKTPAYGPATVSTTVGGKTYSSKFTVVPKLVSIKSSTSGPKRGQSFVATITLAAPAGPGGADVRIYLDTDNLTGPSLVRVAAGKATATMNLMVKPTAALGADRVSASLADLDVEASFTIKP